MSSTLKVYNQNLFKYCENTLNLKEKEKINNLINNKLFEEEKIKLKSIKLSTTEEIKKLKQKKEAILKQIKRKLTKILIKENLVEKDTLINTNTRILILRKNHILQNKLHNLDKELKDEIIKKLNEYIDNHQYDINYTNYYKDLKKIKKEKFDSINFRIFTFENSYNTILKYYFNINNEPESLTDLEEIKKKFIENTGITKEKFEDFLNGRTEKEERNSIREMLNNHLTSKEKKEILHILNKRHSFFNKNFEERQLNNLRGKFKRIINNNQISEKEQIKRAEILDKEKEELLQKTLLKSNNEIHINLKQLKKKSYVTEIKDFLKNKNK